MVHHERQIRPGYSVCLAGSSNDSPSHALLVLHVRLASEIKNSCFTQRNLDSTGVMWGLAFSTGRGYTIPQPTAFISNKGHYTGLELINLRSAHLRRASSENPNLSSEGRSSTRIFPMFSETTRHSFIITFSLHKRKEQCNGSSFVVTTAIRRGEH